jgi:hypothetical protein
MFPERSPQRDAYATFRAPSALRARGIGSAFVLGGSGVLRSADGLCTQWVVYYGRRDIFEFIAARPSSA